MVRQKEVLSKDQVQKLIDNAPTFKMQLVVGTMVQTGMRVGELVNFKPDWIEASEKVIYVQDNEVPIKWSPKRDSKRRIPITDGLLKNLERLIGNRTTGYVFESQKRRATKSVGNGKVTRRTFGRYTYRSMIRKVNRISVEVLGHKTGTHIFRATYASHLVKAKLDLESIRKLLGHSEIKTTLLYIRALPDFNSWEEVRRVELMNLEI